MDNVFGNLIASLAQINATFGAAFGGMVGGVTAALIEGLRWSSDRYSIFQQENARLLKRIDRLEEVTDPKNSTGNDDITDGALLENLLNIRETLAARGHSTEAVDKRIAVERMRIVRSDLDRATPARAATLEITAKRTNPQDQSAKIIYDDKGKAVGYIAPPTTYFGKPKMPPKAPVRNY